LGTTQLAAVPMPLAPGLEDRLNQIFIVQRLQILLDGDAYGLLSFLEDLAQ
jgi:hypothetical protein